MDNMNFRKIENIGEYISEGLKNGRFQSKTYQKVGEITARIGKVGEKIVTIMANGLEETKNVVIADKNGNPGWVITNPAGEQYIIEDSVFKTKYEKIPETVDGYRPIWNPITAAQIDENICFIAPWGEIQNIVLGGYLVFNKNYSDVYGVQEAEFISTYKDVEEII